MARCLRKSSRRALAIRPQNRLTVRQWRRHLMFLWGRGRRLARALRRCRRTSCVATERPRWIACRWRRMRRWACLCVSTRCRWTRGASVQWCVPTRPTAPAHCRHAGKVARPPPAFARALLAGRGVLRLSPHGLPASFLVAPQGTQGPSILDPDVCLLPGVPVVRVENAPGNARRIFTGVDIVADCDNVLDVVWAVLNDYPRLAEAVPNLVENEVVAALEGGGARLRQVRSGHGQHEGTGGQALLAEADGSAHLLALTDVSPCGRRGPPSSAGRCGEAGPDAHVQGHDHPGRRAVPFRPAAGDGSRAPGRIVRHVSGGARARAPALHGLPYSHTLMLIRPPHAPPFRARPV